MLSGAGWPSGRPAGKLLQILFWRFYLCCLIQSEKCGSKLTAGDQYKSIASCSAKNCKHQVLCGQGNNVLLCCQAGWRDPSSLQQPSQQHHMMGAGCCASGPRRSSTSTTSRRPGAAVVGPAAYRPGR